MTSLARTAALSLSPLAALLARLHRHLAVLEAAHDRHARFAALTRADQRDLALPAEVILGEPAHDPALPFFFRTARD